MKEHSAELCDTAKTEPLVAVVVPTHNRRQVLLDCLESVSRLEWPSLLVVVVFDGCVDGSQAEVRRRFPHVLTIEGDGSLWWSGAVNAGITAARSLGAGYHCLLNDDVQPDAGMLTALMQTAVENPGAIVGGKVCRLSDPTRIWSAGGLIDWLRGGTHVRGADCKDGPEWDQPAHVAWFPGMGTLIPDTVLQRIGMMDADRFPQYFGDIDFCLRARRAGVPLVFCPEARLLNDVASTGALLPAGPITWRVVRSVLCSQRSHANWQTRWRFWLRHCPPLLIAWQAVRFYLPVLCAMGKKLTWDRIRSWVAVSDAAA